MRFTLAALQRRRLLGALCSSFGLAVLFGKRPEAAPADRGGFVVVNGWVLRRSDLDLIR